MTAIHAPAGPPAVQAVWTRAGVSATRGNLNYTAVTRPSGPGAGTPDPL